MQLETKLSQDLKAALRDKHVQALYDLLNSRKKALTVPDHIANMQIKNYHTGKANIVPVIVPAVNIYIDPRNLYEGGKTADARAFIYRISYNNQAFPLSHVFSSSGSLCLGSIFVPEIVSIYEALQPLETLFLANDRVYSHGDPQIKPSGSALQLMQKYILDLPVAKFDSKNWAHEDLLFNVTHDLLTKYDESEAKKRAHEIFKALFTTKRKEK